MTISESKLLGAMLTTIALTVASSIPASARIVTNRLAANRVVANRIVLNAVTDKARFGFEAVTISKITLPDGTVMMAH
ncbi:hypothetical protein [Microvirga massiliensis]|uniref:hypothetical protein n=1 Tax=Microvirga massiliensis TaxID=1033741 RepID=UPI000AB19458|nr:hypothetical protein [Microvirga massiliensis]